MRLLADENVQAQVVELLRAEFDVEWIAQTQPGATDLAVLERPDISELIVITFDRDFGALIFTQGLPAPKALVYTRLARTDPATVAARIIEVLRGKPIDRHIVTIDARGARRRPFGARND